MCVRARACVFICYTGFFLLKEFWKRKINVWPAQAEKRCCRSWCYLIRCPHPAFLLQLDGPVAKSALQCYRHLHSRSILWRSEPCLIGHISRPHSCEHIGKLQCLSKCMSVHVSVDEVAF